MTHTTHSEKVRALTSTAFMLEKLEDTGCRIETVDFQTWGGPCKVVLAVNWSARGASNPGETVRAAKNMTKAAQLCAAVNAADFWTQEEAGDLFYANKDERTEDMRKAYDILKTGDGEALVAWLEA